MKNSHDKPQTVQTRTKRQFCTFILSDHLFGVDILDVREINSTSEFTPIFHAPKEIRGYVNIRGQIHLILDLRQLLGYNPAAVNPESRLVLFKPCAGENFGVLVDKIGDAVSVEEDRIEDRNKEEAPEAEADMQRMANLTIGVCKLDNALMVILDPKKFLKTIKTE